MTVINPPGFLQNAGATHTGEQFRNWLGALIAGRNTTGLPLIARGGVHPALGNMLQVTQSGSPAMSVVVKSGVGFIPGTEGSKQGVYAVENDADVTLTISAAHASLGRIDSVVFKVEDQAYSGGVNTSSLAVVAGTPSGSPAAPTLPNNALELAQVTVVASDTSITNGEITDKRKYLAATGGTITCTSTTRPAAGTIPNGQTIFELDTLKGYISVDGGTNWIQNYPPQTKIAENILVGTAASVTFSSIPQTFRHLNLKMLTRGDTAAAFTVARIRFNGDTGANYDNEQISANGASLAAFETLNATGSDVGESAAATAVAGSSSFHLVQIPFYTGTTFWKSLSTLHQLQAQTSGGAANAHYAKVWVSRWRNTGAITSITIFPAAGNFIAGSSFILYGEV